MEKPAKKFLKLPHLEGGRELLKQFIRDQLQYPPDAIKAGIEGDVIVRFKVTGKGEVIDPVVEKGIGHGCDEEAIRLVRMLRYQAVKNRGVRVISGQKIKIPFRIKKTKTGQSVRYNYTASKATPKGIPAAAEKDQNKSGVYTYTIRIGQS